MKRTHLASALALVCLFVCTSDSRADLIAWSYDWTATPPSLTAGTGKITMSNEVAKFAKGDSQVVATNLKEFSTADPGTPDMFGPMDGVYSLKLTLKDIASGKSDTLTFGGQLQGKFSAFNSAVTNKFTDPIEQTIQIGNTIFKVTMNSYTPPGPPEQGNLGSIGAFVQVSNVPEPGSMILAGFGLVAGAMAWKRRRPRVTQ